MTKNSLQKNIAMKDSGIEWIGDIPNEWYTRKLKYISDIDTSGIFGDEVVGEIEAKLATTAQLSINGRWNLVKMEERFFSKNDYKKFKTMVGDIVVVKSSGSSTNIITGKAGFISEDEAGIVFGNFLLRVRTKNDVVSRFLYFFLTSHITRQRIELMCSSTTYPNLKVWKYISALILLPPTKTQKRIADFLDEKTGKIDKVIKKKQKLIELLKEKRTSLITRAVTKGLDLSAKMKDSGVKWIGKIPSDWDVMRVKNIFELSKEKINGESKKHQIYSLTLQGLKERDISSNEGQIATSYENYARLRNNDLVLNPMDLISGFVGRQKSDGVISPAYSILRPRKHRQSTEYFERYLQFHYYYNIFFPFGKGVSYDYRWTLGDDTLANFPILNPPTDTQKQIADFLNEKTTRIDQAVQKIQVQMEKLKEYRASLIYHAVTGKTGI